MLESSDIQFACNDARVRNAAIVDLIHQGDRHALALLQFYIAVASAAISAAAAIFLTAAPIPKVFAWVPVGIAVPLIGGAYCCFASMWTADIHLPGRSADFWQWAMRPDIDTKKVYEAYLDRLLEGQATNTALNKRMAKWLDYAKRCGVLALFCGLLSLLVAVVARL
ncbi:hypothetical protein IVB22_34095 [Bradyrhizobium sp. 190]|uniref:hypothetical protein n=1 Tax=Bradyrhizobium sp. 190 TaxID=2782658 RepID=UPI001FF7DC1B|nr:hypothetical protein [Bradyrhizobium sp. 190]MCK1517451.1 hypothetical protein [Bradyrhizobium sp. 190]